MLVAVRSHLRTHHYHVRRKGHKSQRKSAEGSRDPGLLQQSDQPPPLHRHEARRERGAEEPDSLQGHGNHCQTVNSQIQGNASAITSYTVVIISKSVII